MRTIRVWFNHWFSTAYHIIGMLKDDERFNFVVVGSSTDRNSVYRAVCDEWAVEPWIPDVELYVDFCLEFCREHNIEVFVPRRHMLSVARRFKDFEAIGVLVLVERDYGLMSALCDKAKTYRLFERRGIGNVPPYRCVTDVKDFEAAYKQLKTADNRVCFKFAVDEGAVSFRVVDDSIGRDLTRSVGAKITYDGAVSALSGLGAFAGLIVMPYLTGDEVSVDCLYMADGEHIVIPRFKSRFRSEEIRFEDKIVDVCCSFLDNFKLECPCNLQFKYENGVAYLLEVNTRMSGGVQLSYAACGVNIANIAVNRLLGVEKRGRYVKDMRTVSFIETPVVLR